MRRAHSGLSGDEREESGMGRPSERSLTVERVAWNQRGARTTWRGRHMGVCHGAVHHRGGMAHIDRPVVSHTDRSRRKPESKHLERQGQDTVSARTRYPSPPFPSFFFLWGGVWRRRRPPPDAGRDTATRAPSDGDGHGVPPRHTPPHGAPHHRPGDPPSERSLTERGRRG